MAEKPESGTLLSRTLHENGIPILINRMQGICSLPLKGDEQDVPRIPQARLSFLHRTNIGPVELSIPLVDRLVNDWDITSAKTLVKFSKTGMETMAPPGSVIGQSEMKVTIDGIGGMFLPSQSPPLQLGNRMTHEDMG